MRTSLRDTQFVEQLVKVPTIVSHSLLQRIKEQNVDIPVPGGGGRSVGLQGFPSEQSSTPTRSSKKRISERIVEQIVDRPPPKGRVQQEAHRCDPSLVHTWVMTSKANTTKMHKAPRRSQKAQTLPFSTNSVPEREKTRAHVGKQHATPVLQKDQEATCRLTQRNVMLIRS